MGLTNDIRFAFRTLLRSPGFTLVTVLTLGLGIGNTVVVNGQPHVMVVVAPEGFTFPENTELPVFNVQTMDSVVNGSLARTSIVTALLVPFASVSLALAGVGVFSVVSYSVGCRVREVAIRTVLGGTPSKVMALIVKQGLSPVATRLLLGVATALALIRILTSRLFGVAAHDPATFSGAVLTAWLPVRWAVRIQPMTILRSE